MKHFKVCINYGRKCAAYDETIVTAATEADDASIKQSVGFYVWF